MSYYRDKHISSLVMNMVRNGQLQRNVYYEEGDWLARFS